MAYNFYNGYNAYGYNGYGNYPYMATAQQYPQMQAQQFQNPQQQPADGRQQQRQDQQAPAINPQGVIVQWVMGKAAAKSFIVPLGQTAFLFDTEKAVFYEKSVDKNGVPLPIRVHYYSDISDEEDDAQSAAAAVDMSEYVRRDEIDTYINNAIKKLTEVKNNVTEHIPESTAAGTDNTAKSAEIDS